MRARCFPIEVALLLCAACTTAHEPDEFIAEDSLGVRISFQPLGLLSEPLTLDPDPVVHLGRAEGTSGDLFVRVSDGRVVGGDVLIVDQGTGSWTLFDDQGTARVRAGGPGPGPGEFRSLFRALSFRGDSIVAWDQGSHRVSFWGLDGRYARSSDVGWSPVTGGLTFLVGVTADSLLVIQQEAGWSTGEPGAVAAAEVRLQILRPNGSVLHEIGPLEGRDLTTAVADGGRAGGALVHLGAQSVARTLDEYVIWGPARTPELRWFTSDGRLERVTRWSDSRRAVTRQTRRQQDRVQGYEGDVYAEVMPAYDQVVAASSGVVWVREFGLDEGNDRRWLAVSPDGRIRTTALIPVGFRVLDFTEDAVLLVLRDDLDVEHVQLRRLTDR